MNQGKGVDRSSRVRHGHALRQVTRVMREPDVRRTRSNAWLNETGSAAGGSRRRLSVINGPDFGDVTPTAIHRGKCSSLFDSLPRAKSF